MSRLHLKLLCAWLAVLVLGFGVYVAGLSGYWVFDDFHNIVQNQGLADRVLDKAHLIALLTSSNAGLLHRPLSVLSFFLDSYWFGLSPYAFKVTNILIHLAAGLAFAGMGRCLLSLYRARHAPELDPARIDWIVLIATALWLVHPLNLTAVLYVVQRETSLGALFTALAIWSYLVARRRQDEGRSAAWILWLLTPALMLLGLCCKENAALTPVFLFVIELTLLGFKSTDGRPTRQLQAFFVLFLALPALATVYLVLRGSPALVGGYAIRDFTMGERLLTECRVMFDYLRWSFFPDLRQLGLYHDDIAPSHGLLQPLSTLFALLGVAGLLALAAVSRRRLPLLSFAILWFFAGQLMESTILPLELVFEHRNYVPLYGLLLGIVATLGFSTRFVQQRQLLLSLALFATLLFAGLTALRASEWRSPLAFAVYEAGHHPGSSRAQYEVGAILTAMVMDGKTELKDQAEQAMLKARTLDQNSISEDMSLVIMDTVLKQPDKVHDYLQDATDRAGHIQTNAETQAALQTGIAFSNDRMPLPFADMDGLFQAVLGNPHTLANPCYRGDILNTYALFLEDNGRIPQAMGDMHQALVLCPSLIFTRINYAQDLITYGDIPDAQEQIKIIAAANSFGQYTLYLQKFATMIAEVEKHK